MPKTSPTSATDQPVAASRLEADVVDAEPIVVERAGDGRQINGQESPAFQPLRLQNHRAHTAIRTGRCDLRLPNSIGESLLPSPSYPTTTPASTRTRWESLTRSSDLSDLARPDPETPFLRRISAALASRLHPNPSGVVPDLASHPKIRFNPTNRCVRYPTVSRRNQRTGFAQPPDSQSPRGRRAGSVRMQVRAVGGDIP